LQHFSDFVYFVDVDINDSKNIYISIQFYLPSRANAREVIRELEALFSKVDGVFMYLQTNEKKTYVLVGSDEIAQKYF
jgi:hypothetical protein